MNPIEHINKMHVPAIMLNSPFTLQDKEWGFILKAFESLAGKLNEKMGVPLNVYIYDIIENPGPERAHQYIEFPPKDIH